MTLLASTKPWDTLGLEPLARTAASPDSSVERQRLAPCLAMKRSLGKSTSFRVSSFCQALPVVLLAGDEAEGVVLEVLVDVDVAVLVDLEVVGLHLDRAVLAEDGVAFLGLEEALLAEDEGAGAAIALAVGGLNGEEALAVHREVEVVLGLLEGALLVLGEDLVVLDAGADLAYHGGHVARAEGVKGDARRR